MLKNFILLFVMAVFANAAFAQPVAKQVSKGVVNGSAVELPKPEYPKAAQAVKASGEVKIQVTIDEAGNVISAKIISGHPLLAQAAEQAAWQAKFKPTMLSGVAVKVSGIIIYNFVPAKESSLYEHPDEIWAIGFVFGMMERIGEEDFKKFGDEGDFSKGFDELAKDFPEEIAAEKPLLEKFAKSTGAERQRLAGEIGNSLQKYFKQNELDVFQTGLLLGSVIGESLKAFIPLMDDKTINPDTTQVKTALLLFRDKLNSSKQHLSPQTAANFTELATLADSDLNSLANMQKLIAIVSKIMNSLPDDGENEKTPQMPESPKTGI